MNNQGMLLLQHVESNCSRLQCLCVAEVSALYFKRTRPVLHQHASILWIKIETL